MHDGKDGKFSSLSGLQFETFHKMKQISDEQYDGGDDDYKPLYDGGERDKSEVEQGVDGQAERAAFKKQFADQVQSQLHVNEVINFKNMLIFEPQTLQAKMNAMFQNSFEAVFLVGTVALAAAFPSLASIIMWLATHNLLIASTWRPQARVKWGLVFLGVDILGLIFLIASKVVVMTTCDVKGADAAAGTGLKGTECLKFKTCKEYTDRASTLRSWGYHLQDEVG